MDRNNIGINGFLCLLRTLRQFNRDLAEISYPIRDLGKLEKIAGSEKKSEIYEIWSDIRSNLKNVDRYFPDKEAPEIVVAPADLPKDHVPHYPENAPDEHCGNSDNQDQGDVRHPLCAVLVRTVVVPGDKHHHNGKCKAETGHYTKGCKNVRKDPFH